jgi:hypothetical protein
MIMISLTLLYRKNPSKLYNLLRDIKNCTKEFQLSYDSEEIEND